MASGSPPLAGPDVEGSIRRRLYGERGGMRATPISRRRRAVGAPGARAGDVVGYRYRLSDLLQAGGVTTVHRARDVRLERVVVVKLIAERFARDAAAARRVRGEARLWARLSHPNVVAVLDAGAQPTEFIVTEFVDGLDGRALLEGRGPLGASETVDLVAQLCDGLGHVHACGVLHGDVSLGNMLIGRADGTAKLVDFGAAVRLDGATRSDGPIIGTPGYVAPEVLTGANRSAQSDLYSLAVAAHRLLVGPPDARSGAADATVPGPTAGPRMAPLAERPPDLPHGLVAAVERALAADPAARQESVSQFRAELVDGANTPVRLRPHTGAAFRSATAALPRAA